jgi:hypothetical protein
MFGIIYCATNLVNQKKYIGQTKGSLISRKNSHIKCAINGNGFYFHDALRKYNFNFSWEILHVCKTFNELNNMEIFYIAKYKTAIPKYGYNLTSGGSTDMTYNVDVVKRRSISKQIKYTTDEINFIIDCYRNLILKKDIIKLLGSNFNKQIKNVYSINRILNEYLSKEEITKIIFKMRSNISKSRIERPETRLKKREANLGRHHTTDVLKKMSENRIGKFLKTVYITINEEKIIIEELQPEHIEFILNKFKISNNMANAARLFNQQYGSNLTKGQVHRTIHNNLNL